MREEINQYLSKTKRQTIGVICVFLLIFGGAPLFQKLASPHREVIFRLEQICSSLEIWTINVNDSRRRFRGNPGKDINFDVFLKAKEETLDLQVLNGLADQIEDYIKSTEWDDAVRRFTQITQKDNRPYSMVRVGFYGTPHQRHILDGDSEREGVFYLDMKRVVTQETGEVSWVVGRREYPKVSVLFPPIAELTAFLLLTVLLVWDYWFHLSIYQSQDYHPRLYWHTRWQEEKSENRLICRRRKVLKYGFWLLMLLSLLIYDFRNPSDLTAPSQALLIWLVFAFWFRLWIRGDIPKIRYSQRMKRMILGLGLCFCLLTGMLWLVLQARLLCISAFYLAIMVVELIYVLDNKTIIPIVSVLLKPWEDRLLAGTTARTGELLTGQPALLKIGISGRHQEELKCQLKKLLEERHHLLSGGQTNLVFTTPKDYRGIWGIIQSIQQNFPGQWQYLITGVESLSEEEINRTCSWLKPQIGLMAAMVGETSENRAEHDIYLYRQFALARAVGRDGVMIVNRDDEAIRQGMDKYHASNYITYGQNKAADICWTVLSVAAGVVEIGIFYQGAEKSYHLELNDPKEIPELAAALAVMVYLEQEK